MRAKMKFEDPVMEVGEKEDSADEVTGGERESLKCQGHLTSRTNFKYL